MPSENSALDEAPRTKRPHESKISYAKKSAPAASGASLGPSIIFPILAVIALLPWLSAIENVWDAIFLALLILICAVGTVRSYSGGARPLGLVFYPFTFAWLGVGPIYQLSHGGFAWGDIPLFAESGIISAAVLYTLLAVLAFTGGYEFWRHWQRPAEVDGTTMEVRPLVVWVLILVAVALAPIALSASGGLSGMFATRFDRADAFEQAGLTQEAVGGLRYALGKQIPIALSIAAVCLSVIRARKRIQESGVMGLCGNEFSALLLSLGLIVLYCNPIANSRYIAVIAFGSAALYVFQPRSGWGGLMLAAASVCGTLVIYPLLDIFRRGFEETTSLKSGAEAFGSVDFDGFQQVANGVIFVEDRGHSFGHYSLSAILYFLPRSSWEGKAIPASIDVAANRGYRFTDLSLPFHAEMLIEFGIIGMVVIMVLFGIFASRTDASWQAMASTRLGLAAPLIAVALLGFLRGPLGSLAPIYLTAVGLFLLALKRTGTDLTASEGKGSTRLTAGYSARLKRFLVAPARKPVPPRRVPPACPARR